jgi:hypothetical protein
VAYRLQILVLIVEGKYFILMLVLILVPRHILMLVRLLITLYRIKRSDYAHLVTGTEKGYLVTGTRGGNGQGETDRCRTINQEWKKRMY